jgi:signal transduction histidine kinase
MKPAASDATAVSLEELRRIDLFDDLDDEQLARWVAVTHVRTVPAGELIAEQGKRAPGLHLVLEGTVQALFVTDGRVEPAGQHHAPTWMGAIAVLIDIPVGVRMQAETECRIGTVRGEDFLELVFDQRCVHQRVMQVVRPVLGRLEAVEQNRERLAALGTMAAGLAHELNNPAAAAKRAAADMTDAVEVLSSTIGHFVDSGMERAQAQQLGEMQREALERAASSTPLDTLAAADAEDELTDALERAGVAEPWRLAEPLVRAGIDAEWLDRLEEVAGPATGAALAWVAASLTARGLAAELCDSAERMTRLVGAVKAYSYMDRGDVVEMDIHEGLDTTLVVLGHKLKHTSNAVEREYDRSLPKLLGRGSELNQVWTNLLDNAIDALGEKGTITVRTRLDGDCAVVEVSDDGPGVPEDIRERIFEPFFTTKPVGAGTGLGLDAARRIVEERHRGTIGVQSRPGETTFQVWLPLADTAR